MGELPRRVECLILFFFGIISNFKYQEGGGARRRHLCPLPAAHSDFGLVDGDHGEAPERLLGPPAPSRWAASPIRRTRELEAFLGRLLRWVFDGLPVAGAETAPLSITTAHAKVAVSLGCVRPTSAWMSAVGPLRTLGLDFQIV